MAKILGKGDYRVELSFYAHGEWHRRIYCKKTLKGAFILARVLQHNLRGAMYHFHLIDYKQGKVRWMYYEESSTCKWCNRFMLREGRFDGIMGYKSIMQGV